MPSTSTEGFLVEVLSNSDAAALDHYRETVTTLNEKVVSLKSEFNVSLEKCFGTLDLDINRVSSWFTEIEEVDREAEAFAEDLKQKQFAETLSSEELVYIQQELEVCISNITVLATMMEIVKNLESAEASEIYKAAGRLRKAKDCLKLIVNEFDDVDFKRVEWVRSIQSLISSRIDEAYEFAVYEWNKKFHFERNTLVADPDISGCKIPQMIDALNHLGYYSLLWERFCQDIWQELLSKAATRDYTLKVTRPNQQLTKTPMLTAQKDVPVRDTDADPVSPNDEAVQSAVPYGTQNAVVMHVKKLESPITDISVVFKNIRRVVGQLTEIFDEKPEVMQDMAKSLGPKLVLQLTSKCLKSLILQESRGNKDKARANIVELHEFRDKLQEMNFIIPDEYESAFDEFERDFDSLFTRQLREATLAQVRVLIKSDLHHTVETTPDEASFRADSNSDEMVLQKNPYERQVYTISRSIADMVDLLQQYADNYPQDSLLICHAFNMYISIVNIPKHDFDAKDFIPISAVLVHNNCMYLAQHASMTFSRCEDLIPLLRTKGTQAFSYMMKSTRTHLNALIYQAMAGLDEESETTKQKREQQLMGIAFEFDKLNSVFKEVLPSRPWREALGALVDHTINEICSKVLLCEDISATTGNDLAEAFTKFAVETSAVFKREGLSTREVEAVTAKLVPKWHRFRLLTFVLTASMREIEDKWVNGCGPLSMAFTAEEVRKLVRALFQNTEHRAAFLSSIK